MNFDLRSRAAAEFLGTSFLLAAVVGPRHHGRAQQKGSVPLPWRTRVSAAPQGRLQPRRLRSSGAGELRFEGRLPTCKRSLWGETLSYWLVRSYDGCHQSA
jgi:hypothetical protein